MRFAALRLASGTPSLDPYPRLAVQSGKWEARGKKRVRTGAIAGRQPMAFRTRFRRVVHRIINLECDFLSGKVAILPNHIGG